MSLVVGVGMINKLRLGVLCLAKITMSVCVIFVHTSLFLCVCVWYQTCSCL